MSDGALTHEMFKRFVAERKQRMVEPIEPPIIYCHPVEAWKYSLMGYDSGYENRRWKALKWVWRVRKMFDDERMMVALSSILRGSYF